MCLVSTVVRSVSLQVSLPGLLLSLKSPLGSTEVAGTSWVMEGGSFLVPSEFTLESCHKPNNLKKKKIDISESHPSRRDVMSAC